MTKDLIPEWLNLDQAACWLAFGTLNGDIWLDAEVDKGRARQEALKERAERLEDSIKRLGASWRKEAVRVRGHKANDVSDMLIMPMPGYTIDPLGAPPYEVDDDWEDEIGAIVPRNDPIGRQKKGAVWFGLRFSRADIDQLRGLPDPEFSAPESPREIALKCLQANGSDVDAAAAVIFQHPHISNADLAEAVPTSRTANAVAKSKGERGRRLRRDAEAAYPNLPKRWKTHLKWGFVGVKVGIIGPMTK